MHDDALLGQMKVVLETFDRTGVAAMDAAASLAALGRALSTTSVPEPHLGTIDDLT